MTATPNTTQAFVLTTNLLVAPMLVQLLARRRVRVAQGETVAAGSVLVLSAQVAKDMGGKLVEIAKTCGAKKIVTLEEGSAAFSITSEMGGRFLRVMMPVAQSQNALRNSALLYLVDMISAELQEMVAADPRTSRLLDLVARVARSNVSVFINGPSGSGKEVLARKLHNASPRAAAPFVAINCAAIPENMLEALLFGHEKGAFTGAQNANKGIIRAAEGGTLLLDEVSEMPMSLQAKLLRVLQERKVTPLGSQTEVDVDIRIIATSNRNMAAEVAAQRFREDLFYRLNIFPLATQSLANRPDDIPVLTASLIRRHLPQDNAALPTITQDAFDKLSSYTWPGNVRELENVIQRALVLFDGIQITAEDIILDAGESLNLPHLCDPELATLAAA